MQSLLKLVISIFLAISSAGTIVAQRVYFFTDSGDPNYYDTGLAFPTAPSTIMQSGPGGTGDKIPVSSINAYQGNNCLEVKWKSMAGGDWSAMVIAPGWPFQDITSCDTLSFWVYSETTLSKVLLPLVYMEGAPGTTKSQKHKLSIFSNDIPAGNWTKIKVPLSVFFTDPATIQFNQVKAIILGQDTADGADHALLVDYVTCYKSSSSASLPSIPAGLAAKGYDSHVYLTWSANHDTTLAGYNVFRSGESGTSYPKVKYVAKEGTFCTDFTRTLGSNLSLKYKITAVNSNNDQSGYSDPVNVSTRDFTDDELLTMVQEATFRYFWDYAHPISGLARERTGSGETVTMGGSGFGIMGIPVAIERSFITRQQGVQRMIRILNFLDTADRFHGAWPHWMNGTTGKVIPFSAQDNGGDLVETSFMLQGLLTVKQYFNGSSADEIYIRDKITSLYQAVDWNWYRKTNQNVLFWHWSPNYQFTINMELRGWNEVMICYLLAIASPTNGIPSHLWNYGWAGGSGFINGGIYYGYPLFLGYGMGGPLFFTHYSFLGFDPREKKDAYANYFIQNQNQSFINHAYCNDNPKGYTGYGTDCWGLTASDDPWGYLAHEPGTSNDNGTISPTAALSSMPYTPEFSISALKHFYRDLGDRLWGNMGFLDAFNQQQNWIGSDYLAIDQGPIIVMIENYRTGLLWNNFMSNPEIQTALTNIGFVTDNTSISNPSTGQKSPVSVYPNPCRNEFFLVSHSSVKIEKAELINAQGKILKNFIIKSDADLLSIQGIESGLYLLKIQYTGGRVETIKIQIDSR